MPRFDWYPRQTYTSSATTSSSVWPNTWTTSSTTSSSTTYDYGVTTRLWNSRGWVDLGYLDGAVAVRTERDRADLEHERLNQWTAADPQMAYIPQRDLYQSRAEEDRHRRVMAEDRATELLLSMLTPEQRASFLADKRFDLVGSDGTRFRIEHGVAGNVAWLKPDGTVGGRLCAHPDMAQTWLPTADVMLGQLLALTTDAAEFVRVANLHAGERPPGLRRRGAVEQLRRRLAVA